MEFALRKGFHVPLSEVDADVFRALRVLEQERQRYESEQQINHPPEQ